MFVSPFLSSCVRDAFEMRSRCFRDAELWFVNIFMLTKHNINFKYANIHPQPLPGEGLGVGSLFLRSSFAWREMKKRMYSGATAKAWQIGCRQKKNFFQNYVTSSQNGSILLIISYLIVWRTQKVRHTSSHMHYLVSNLILPKRERIIAANLP